MSPLGLTVSPSIASLVIVGALATGCAASPPPRVDNPAQASTAITTAAPLASTKTGAGECEVFCNAAQLVTHTEFPDHHARAEANADQVFDEGI
jgi:hypothetical protein